MKKILLILLFSISLQAQVPNTPIFSLSDVLTEIGLSANSTLVDAFTNANIGGFDPVYEGSKDRLSNFRNYTHSDTTAPTQPTVTLYSKGTANILVNIFGSTDNIGVVGYDMYLNNVYHGFAVSSTYNFTGLNANTGYTIKAKAKDTANNTSIFSSVLNVTTNSGVSVTPFLSSNSYSFNPCSLPTTTTYYVTGFGRTPAMGRYAYSDSAGTIPLANSGNGWYKTSISGDKYKVGSNGQITDVIFCF